MPFVAQGEGIPQQGSSFYLRGESIRAEFQLRFAQTSQPQGNPGGTAHFLFALKQLYLQGNFTLKVAGDGQCKRYVQVFVLSGCHGRQPDGSDDGRIVFGVTEFCPQMGQTLARRRVNMDGQKRAFIGAQVLTVGVIQLTCFVIPRDGIGLQIELFANLGYPTLGTL